MENIFAKESSLRSQKTLPNIQISGLVRGFIELEKKRPLTEFLKCFF